MFGNNDEYLEYVQQIARKQQKVFMLDTGEGNDYDDALTGWYIEDLSGWLIEECMKQKFNEDRNNGKAHITFSDYYVFAKWHKNVDGKIEVEFVKFPT